MNKPVGKSQTHIIKPTSSNPHHQIHIVKSTSSNPHRQIHIIKSTSSNLRPQTCDSSILT
ncbi:hypothetical protein BS50DRAFT_580085 [Corynespora cassiicola Philippines]|uniref:Uncharacterized protein n=1 Tax=Corynespora cassiicola Philippines TaxID=1448308 RepID=A0A2T2N1H8_CORCC|nr:hypothetical protein BS50DRAFT_580240 [Corynespora cassiicola Philippines]PSN59282.1 hypothetical protein BS50DRAFT_580085 [Corynespora cassiicola Philippines]